ncbi:MAG: CaiB/BaiF CoA transferase family protein [Smithellaceae bacterium]
MAGALSDVRVADFTQVLAGPLVTCWMAELGAEIIKIEKLAPGGDLVRHNPPFTDKGEAHIYTQIGRGKKTVSMDLSKKEARQIALDIIAQSEILIENFAPGVMKSLGLDYDEVVKVKPDIVYCSISGFGQTGPYSHRTSFDITAQATGGAMSLTGPEGGQPTKSGPSIGDQSGALYGTIAILAALHYKRTTGKGQYIDISMQDTVFWTSGLEFLPMYLKHGLYKRMGNQHSQLSPWDLFKTKDGEMIIGAVAAPHWKELAKAMGRDDLFTTDEEATILNRIQAEPRAIIHKAVEDWAIRHTNEEIQAKLEKAKGVCFSPVLTMEDLVKDPQIQHRNMVVEIEQKISGKLKVLGSVFKMSETPGNPCRPALAIGECNEEVYGKLLGYSDEKIKELREQKVI